MQEDGRTDMTKLRDAFRNLANAPNNRQNSAVFMFCSLCFQIKGELLWVNKGTKNNSAKAAYMRM